MSSLLKIGGIILVVVVVFPLLIFGLMALVGMFSLGWQDSMRKKYESQPDILTLEVTCPNVQGAQIPNRLALMEKQTFGGGGIGDSGTLIRSPLLTFNGKVVSRSEFGRIHPYYRDPGLPINPSDRAKLIIKTFHAESAESDWTIYVNPAEFSRAEYEQIVSCYEANRQNFENILKTSQVSPDWNKNTLSETTQTSFGFDERAQRIAHLVYGELPQPKVFSTKLIRSGAIDDDKWVASSTETLTIYASGRWQIVSSGKSGTLSWGGNMAEGVIKVSGSDLIFDVENLIPPMIDAAKQISDRTYIESFTNSEGKKLTDFYQIGRIPLKYNP